MNSHSVIEKCFEDAEESGVLQITHKGLKTYPTCVDDYDLVDVLVVELSWNRFTELPQELLSFVMMEKLSCSNNFVKILPDLSHLNALSYVDVSQNQLQSLPVHLCSLPLKILKASHNHISILPTEIGLLSKLQALDLSCNELTNLPSTMGDLNSLRFLNIRRNQIVSLPDELSKLKNLASFNFSCNKISCIPPAFRLISSLIQLDLTNNPLSLPPAQICLRGRLHIIKFLSMAAQQQEKRWTIPKETGINRSPSPSNVSNNSEMFNFAERQPDADNHRRNTMSEGEDEKESVDSGTLRKQTAPNLSSSHDEPCQDVVTVYKNETPPSPSKDKPKLPKKPNSFSLSKQEIKEKQRILQEKGKLTPQPYKSRASTSSSRKWSDNEQADSNHTMSLDRSAVRNLGTQIKSNDSEDARYEKRNDEERLDDLAARKEQLLRNKEEILKSKYRLELIKSKAQNRNENGSEKTEFVSPNSTTSVTSTESSHSSQSEVVFDGIAKRHVLGKPKTNKKLRDGAANFTMRRIFDSAKEEFEQLEKLREAIESRLRIRLPDDLPASMSDGIVLCHLVNHLRKGTIAVIHVPSSGVPKLTMPKCQMNVDAFLDACRRVGVDKTDICTAPDILQEKSPAKLCRTVQALLLAMGAAPPQIVMAVPISPR
ncbi:leucine-rich repeat and calponin homology domain-containing protein 2-like [Hydractinia symbiolongicarpus]|uniref:leucine-rich repeat and calponin homology domain-containing protein 2-like n=1 Tax=Hydractinia symbiolongicarpus TaxID=13093 RepID=UPI00254C80EF|nr:leucine-rich repeat and calponin homology domain-containing protein 2-like [Hydractinia symbiolongicarpus]